MSDPKPPKKPSATPPVPPPAQPTAAQPAEATPQQVAIVSAPEAKSHGIGIAALVLGIVAFVMAFIPFANYLSGFVALVGLILGIVAIVQKKVNTGLGIAAAGISFVALILSIVLAIVYTAAFTSAVSDSLSKPFSDSGSSNSGSSDDSPAAQSNSSFGDTITYKDGLALTVSTPSPFTPGQYAAGADQAANVVFTITLKNGTNKNYDPFLFPTVSSNGTESSSIIDTENNIGLGPTTTVPPGQSVTFQAAFSVADASKLVMEISPGLGYDDAVFTS